MVLPLGLKMKFLSSYMRNDLGSDIGSLKIQWLCFPLKPNVNVQLLALEFCPFFLCYYDNSTLWSY